MVISWKLSKNYIKIIKVFFPIESDEELLKLYKVSVQARSINICIEHYERFKKYKLIKLRLSNIINELKNSGAVNYDYYDNLTTQNKIKLINLLELDRSKFVC